MQVFIHEMRFLFELWPRRSTNYFVCFLLIKKDIFSNYNLLFTKVLSNTHSLITINDY